MEAQKLITMSLGKIATSRSQRGGINLHKNLLVASVLHKARTVYMMDAYQHIIASRKQKQETGACVNSGDESTENNVASANTAGSGSAMTHAPPISHAMDKENSPPTAPADANPANKGAVCSAEGVENTTAIACPDNMVCELSEESENLAGVTECKSQTTTKTVPESADTTRVEKSDCALKNSTLSNTVISPGKRRRSLTSECVDSICDPVTGPKKAKLDIPTSNMENFHSSEEKENLKNSNDNEILCDYDEISSVRDSGVICLVTKSCDKSSSEPMQTEQTQITSLVTIFNSGFSGLCSRNSNSESNLNGQAQPLSCATELKSETVQIPSGIALTV